LEKDWVNTLHIDLEAYPQDFRSKISEITKYLQLFFASGITPEHYRRCINQIASNCHLPLSAISDVVKNVMERKNSIFYNVIIL
jgi:hypothetical protein